MKIKTIKNPITHERKPEFDEQRFSALDEAFAGLCPIDEVAEALEETLRVMNPNVREVVADKKVVIIEIGVNVREVDITGFTFTDLYTSLLAAVIAR